VRGLRLVGSAFELPLVGLVLDCSVKVF
jgi:hypothetical protein